jgi:hypothetical protein
VRLVAIDPGAAGNGLAADAKPENSLARVQGITVVAPSAGGIDGESTDSYLENLREELRTWFRSPIRPEHVEILARRDPDVDRALALDGYNPADGSTGNEKMVTVAVHAPGGANCTSPVKDRVQADLQARRQWGFVFHVIDATRTAIDVAFGFATADGFTPADVKTAAETAVADYLASDSWGLPASGDQRLWQLRPVVRYKDIVGVLKQVDGLDYITALTVEGGTADVTLTGPAPLTEPGTITGTPV